MSRKGLSMTDTHTQSHLLANVRWQFVEFLNNPSVIALVFSTFSLVSDLVQFNIFIIDKYTISILFLALRTKVRIETPSISASAYILGIELTNNVFQCVGNLEISAVLTCRTYSYSYLHCHSYAFSFQKFLRYKMFSYRSIWIYKTTSFGNILSHLDFRRCSTYSNELLRTL